MLRFIQRVVAKVTRDVWVLLVFVCAAMALFCIAYNLSSANLLVIMASGVVFGCLLTLFILARRSDQKSAQPPLVTTTMLTPTTLISEVRAAALVTFGQIGTVTIKKERAKADWRAFDRFFGEELVMDVGVRVVAGVNLKYLRDEDVHVSEKSVSILLPPTKVLMVYVDESLTRVVAHRNGWFTGNDLGMMDVARREAMESMVNAAIDKDLFEKAGQQAATTVAAIARGLGFEDIRVTPTMPVIGQHFDELQDPSTIAKIIALPLTADARQDQMDD